MTGKFTLTLGEGIRITIPERTTPPGSLDLAVLTQETALAIVRMTAQQAYELGDMLIEAAS